MEPEFGSVDFVSKFGVKVKARCALRFPLAAGQRVLTQASIRNSLELTMLSLSYAAAIVAILCATIYLFLRLRLFVTTTTMLVGSLLLIYGPLFLTYTLSSGEPQFLIHGLSRGDFTTLHPHPIFAIIKAKVSDIDSVIVAMNFSVALMYAGVIAGIEAVDRIVPRRIEAMRTALANWKGPALQDDRDANRVLLIAVLALFAFMLAVSISENQVGKIWTFLSLTGPDNTERNAFRLHFAGSPNYYYRLILGAIAPMFIIWGILAGWLRKSWPLLIASSLLFIVTFVGKADTLSKAPPAFFLIQLALAAALILTNRISWRVAIGGGCVIALVLYATTRLIMVFPEGTDILSVVYFRVFEATNQALLENFAVFPAVHPFLWGAGIRPVAMLIGVPFMPTYSIVAHTWYGTYDVTSPALFIADAWADFSYLGVVVYSVFAGVVCRSVDAVFLARGKSIVGIAVLDAAFLGVFTLLITALNTALLSGGLLFAPIVAGLLVMATRQFNRRDLPPQSTPTAEVPQGH